MTTNIQVICRFRPPIPGQVESQIYFADERSVLIENQQFNFDHIFHPGKQIDVFKVAAEPVIQGVLEGFNGTVVAYGQTGSGKTHTMEGTTGDDQGIIKRMVNTVFDYIEASPDYVEYRIKISVTELYMEKVRDLQNIKKTDLKIREDKNHSTYIEGVTETSIADQSEIYDILKMCNANRMIASTNMNEQSSRSHMIFLMTVQSIDLRDQSAKTGKLFLVDLAGSEKVSKTGAEGKILDEAKGINKSLSALGQVINALTDGSQHVPYRDSKLTRILQCSFGGNSRTTLIITCSPAQFNLQETLSTLRFGVRAKAIKNKPKINKEHTVEELKMIVQEKEREILVLQEQLSQFKKGIVISEEDKEILKDIQEDFNSDIPNNSEQLLQMQQIMAKYEQEIEMFKQAQFISQQKEIELRNQLRIKEDEMQEKIQDYEHQYLRMETDYQKKLSNIQRTLSQKLGQNGEKDIFEDDQVLTLIDNFVKERVTSKLKQITYLYKKHHKDQLNEQLMAFLTDDKKEFNIQNDQLAELHTQVAQLKKQNLELQTDNSSQQELLETLEKTQQLLDAEKAKSLKLENQLAKNNRNYDEKCKELNNNIEKMLEGVHQVINEKQKYQRECQKLKKLIDDRQLKIFKLSEEVNRLSVENQKLFVKYDQLKELQRLEKNSMLDTSEVNSSFRQNKKIYKCLKGGTKNPINQQIIGKENVSEDEK
ncbi:unnamed protein product (macronuclear) [Paramecium tetraurelia]|uniref:Kinesin-like protein n=1 Tax=Paramecium tetraurelia TaxID=5888 RepID=A0D164_PARTE|nr:uncharacterized protein GSPATT00012305001 [Paramecium tetraurelia]CAK76781.1 unnamed protein product [Paramecium tetraurelia]|eukprot:XP_001444178.1 hypothetical protein (macronuclear) [Paramecium tetraurelia strain d4-2]